MSRTSNIRRMKFLLYPSGSFGAFFPGVLFATFLNFLPIDHKRLAIKTEDCDEM